MLNSFGKKNDLRCPVCLGEWNQAEMMSTGIKKCPYCKTALMPMKISEDGYFRVNWQDIRVLANYALRWTANFDLTNQGNQDSLQALEHIIATLRKHKPEGGLPLTPPFGIVVIRGIKLPPVKEKKEEGDIIWKKNGKGDIISPFFQKNT